MQLCELCDFIATCICTQAVKHATLFWMITAICFLVNLCTSSVNGNSHEYPAVYWLIGRIAALAGCGLLLWSSVVCWYVCRPRPWANKNCWTDWDAVWGVNLGVGPKNDVLDGSPDPHREGAILTAKMACPGHAWYTESGSAGLYIIHFYKMYIFVTFDCLMLLWRVQNPYVWLSPDFVSSVLCQEIG